MPVQDANWGTKGIEKLQQAGRRANVSSFKVESSSNDSELKAGYAAINSIDPRDVANLSASFDHADGTAGMAHINQLRSWAQQHGLSFEPKY